MTKTEKTKTTNTDHAQSVAEIVHSIQKLVCVIIAKPTMAEPIQLKFGQEDAPGGHKTLGSEKSIDLAEDTRVALLERVSNLISYLSKFGFN